MSSFKYIAGYFFACDIFEVFVHNGQYHDIKDCLYKDRRVVERGTTNENE